MMKAYFRSLAQRKAHTDRKQLSDHARFVLNVASALPVGLRLHGGRVELLTLEAAEQLHEELTEALEQARKESGVETVPLFRRVVRSVSDKIRLGETMKQGKPNYPTVDDDVYLAVVSEKQGCYYFLTDGECRLLLAKAVEELDRPEFARLDVAQSVAETDKELRFS